VGDAREEFPVVCTVICVAFSTRYDHFCADKFNDFIDITNGVDPAMAY
jgi:hypothetical protein